jgi:ribosomal-protein-alanine N-acetyltransferase
MVARPPVAVAIDRMTIDDLPEVEAIERESFTTPWPPHAYRTELENNRLAYYIVARAGDQVVGFGGMWIMVDEAHITTFAVKKTWRRQGVGERMLIALLDYARARRAHEATLEVRPSNFPARRLYEKYGFELVGVRPRYYSDDNEDALIMTTPALDGRGMRERLLGLRAEVERRPDVQVDDDGRPVEVERPGAGGGTRGDGSETAADGGPADSSPPDGGEGASAIAPHVLRPGSLKRTRQ